MKNFKNCIQSLDSSVNVYDTRVTSVLVCVLETAMYGEFSVSNATGSFQNHCSVASQMNPFADQPSSSGTGAKRPIRRRDMMALLADVALPFVIDVINKQMDDYLRGELATPSPSMQVLSIKICSSPQYVFRANTWFG